MPKNLIFSRFGMWGIIFQVFFHAESIATGPRPLECKITKKNRFFFVILHSRGLGPVAIDSAWKNTWKMIPHMPKRLKMRFFGIFGPLNCKFGPLVLDRSGWPTNSTYWMPNPTFWRWNEIFIVLIKAVHHWGPLFRASFIVILEPLHQFWQLLKYFRQSIKGAGFGIF